MSGEPDLPPPEAPLLVIDGETTSGSSVAIAAVIGACFALLPLIANSLDKVPWLPVRVGRGAEVFVVFGGAALLLVAIAVIGSVYSEKRAHVEVFRESIAFHRWPGEVNEVAWADVTVFCDDSSECVVVVARGSHVPGHFARPGRFTIPTPTEEDRVAVLDLLVKRGIPREGA